MSELLGQCVGLIGGADWSRVRKHTGQYFTHGSIAHQVPRIMEHVTTHLDNLRSAGRLSDHIISSLDPVQDLKFLPFWIIAEILYGDLSLDMKAELTDLAEQRERLWQRMIRGGMTRFSIARLWPWGTASDLRRFKKGWEKFNKQAMDACVISRKNTPIVAMYEAVREGTLLLQELLQTCDEMLFANLDVTIGALSWNLVFLAAHGDTQDRIRREIMTISSDEKAVAKMRNYVQDSSSLLSASILESARLRPLAPFSVPQSAPTSRRIGLFTVPKNTNFIVDTYKLNIQSEFWGSNREIYDPGRFMGAKASEFRYSFWRFGFGPRQCLGKYVADVMLRSLLAELVRDWKLSLHEVDGDWAKRKDSWITCPDLKIRCEPIPG